MLLLSGEMEEEEGAAAAGASSEGALDGAPGAAAPGERLAAIDDPSSVGTFSCHGRDFGAGKVNQDCACVASALGGLAGTAMLCVLDGHGDRGHDVSLEGLFSLHLELERRAERVRRTPSEAPRLLATCFEAVQAHLRALAAQPSTPVNALDSGACAVCALLDAGGQSGGQGGGEGAI